MLFLACVMNFITHDRTYCLYPLETIGKSVSLVLKDYDDKVNEALLKYTDRRFTFCDIVEDGEEDFRHKEVRWVEDKWTWILQLDDVASRSGFLNPLRLTTWSILTVPRECHRIHLQIVYVTQEDPVYPIVVATSRLAVQVKLECMEMVLRGLIIPCKRREKEW